MTPSEVYDASLQMLERYCSLTNSPDVELLLARLSAKSNGVIIDKEAREVWQQSIERAIKCGDEIPPLTLVKCSHE